MAQNMDDEFGIPKYDEVGGFSEDLAGVKLSGKWGFVDREGNEIGFEKMKIRPATSHDVQAIADIYNEYIVHSTATFDETPLSYGAMAERISEISSAYPYFVCEIEGQVAGYCFAHQWKPRSAYNTTWETAVYLDSRYIGRGIGKLLMQRFIAECRRRGAKALIACITADNDASIALHLQLGFEQVSHFKRVGVKFGTWLDVKDYELRL
ncbi:MAG: GNAT family N-acetyltransferase [Coprobacter sp.]|nr:GNAT family N-acetyltransferase [Coprobacter sp.]